MLFRSLVAMQVEAHGLGEGWTVEAAITTPLGAVLYSTSSSESGARLGALTGIRRLHFRLAQLPLVPGDYVIRAMLRAPSGAELHSVPVGARFTVAGEPPEQGHVQVSTEFQAL